MRKRNNRKLTEEELVTIKRKNKFIVRKVEEWQNFPYVKPLVCKSCEQLVKLEPKATKYKVILKCPECSEVQYYIPKPILQTRLSRPKVLIDNQERYASVLTEEISD